MEHCISCSLSIFYIKPQPSLLSLLLMFSCSLSIFYIKPQLFHCFCEIITVVPYQYSTSNRNYGVPFVCVSFVVPYQYSTSNRNFYVVDVPSCIVVPYQYSTSNRNSWRNTGFSVQLFLINILHQTATQTDST